MRIHITCREVVDHKARAAPTAGQFQALSWLREHIPLTLLNVIAGLDPRVTGKGWINITGMHQ